MPKKKDNFLNKKRARNTKEPKEIELKIGKENENFDLIECKSEKANKLFQEYLKMKENKKNGNVLKMLLI